MNNQRRNKIRKIICDLETISKNIENVLLEEEMALDGIPENLQDTDKYYDSENSVEMLDDANVGIGDVIESLKEAL